MEQTLHLSNQRRWQSALTQTVCVCVSALALKFRHGGQSCSAETPSACRSQTSKQRPTNRINFSFWPEESALVVADIWRPVLCMQHVTSRHGCQSQTPTVKPAPVISLQKHSGLQTRHSCTEGSGRQARSSSRAEGLCSWARIGRLVVVDSHPLSLSTRTKH